MVPISARLPDDVFAWLSACSLENASTLSDKLRVAVQSMKLLHDGGSNYLDALSLNRDMLRTARDQLAALERSEAEHSEVLAMFLEHLPVMMASLQSASIGTVQEAAQLEGQLVKRCLQLSESLLRQAITPNAAAFDPRVVHAHIQRLSDLVGQIQK